MALTNLDVARGAFAITPSDTALLPFIALGLIIGSVGGGTTLKVTCLDGSVVSFATVSAGQVIPLAVTQVFAAGTAATNIVGLK